MFMNAQNRFSVQLLIRFILELKEKETMEKKYSEENTESFIPSIHSPPTYPFPVLIHSILVPLIVTFVITLESFFWYSCPQIYFHCPTNAISIKRWYFLSNWPEGLPYNSWNNSENGVFWKLRLCFPQRCRSVLCRLHYLLCVFTSFFWTPHL